MDGAQVGSNSGVSHAEILELHQKYDDADAACAAAVGARKELRQIIKGKGINLGGFDQARRDRNMSGEKRQAAQQEYHRQMAALGMPVDSVQVEFAFDREAMDTHRLHLVDTEGYEARKKGQQRDTNKYVPGTEAHQRWDNAWLRAETELAQAGGDGPAANPKRRGRPPGSKNKTGGVPDGEKLH